ncbi:MAG: ATP-binding protein [Hyphomonadaceae bacterium]
MQHDILDILPVPIMKLEPICNDDGDICDLRFAWANQVAEAGLAEDGQPLIGSTMLEHAPYLKDHVYFQACVACIRDKESQNLTLDGAKGTGFAGRIYQCILTPIENGCMSMLQNVTDVAGERDRARGELGMMAAACNDAVTGIGIANTRQEMVYANPAFCKMLKYSEAEILTMKVSDLMHPDELNTRYESAEQLMTHEINQYVTDRRYIAKDGEVILTSVAVSMTTDDNGDELVVAHFRDVREERKTQADLEQALEDATEATRMKSEFLANMSHEIRTPLNGVIGMAQVLSYSNLDTQQAEHLGIIRESSTNLLSLLNDILDLSKVEAGKIEITTVETDIRHKLRGLFKLHEPIAQDKGLEFDLVVHPSVPSRLQVDPVRMRQCVSNLISNALKFTQLGRVVVAVTSEPVGQDHEVTIHVSDTGIGIAQDKVKHVFESFQQADGSTTRNFGGTGLGLTISRKLARLMGGDLSVVSEEGRGSVFTLRFAAQSAATLSETTDRLEAARESRASSESFGDSKVLIVDDNLVNRQVVRSFVKAYGFQTVEAVDGIDAVEKASAEQFDLILMDIHMPRLDGVKAAQKIRESSQGNKNIPMIALTADAMSGDKEKYLEMGMNGYVAKPINERELISQIGQVLSVRDQMVANW